MLFCDRCHYQYNELFLEPRHRGYYLKASCNRCNVKIWITNLTKPSLLQCSMCNRQSDRLFFQKFCSLCTQRIENIKRSLNGEGEGDSKSIPILHVSNDGSISDSPG